MKNSLKKKTNKKGFTLVELVMVVALIAILAAIAVPTVSNVINTANENVDKSNAQTVELALKTSYAELVGKTWDGNVTVGGKTTKYTTSDLTVNVALQHQGMSALPEKKASTSYWTYSDGKVFCDKDHSATKDAFDGTALVKTVLNIS